MNIGVIGLGLIGVSFALAVKKHLAEAVLFGGDKNPNHLKEAIEKNDLEAMKQKTQDLTQSSLKMGEAMYKDQQAAGGAAGAEQPQSDNQREAPKDDDVIDADYEEVDEDKKASGQ